MRYGIVADIHGNLPAFRVALRTLQEEGVDALLCLGDLVGYGPHPNEVVYAVAELDMPCVLGNHDEVVATGQGFERVNELASTTLAWTRERLDPAAREHLAQLPVRSEADGGVLLAHGSLTDPWTYVRRTGEALEQLERVTEFGAAEVLLLGHTHRQLVVTAEGRALATSDGVLARRTRYVPLGKRTVVNPGAVGQSREWRPLARFALLDLGDRHVRLFARPYPVNDVTDALHRAGLPPQSCHVRPPLRKVIRQAVRDQEDRKSR